MHISLVLAASVAAALSWPAMGQSSGWSTEASVGTVVGSPVDTSGAVPAPAPLGTSPRTTAPSPVYFSELPTARSTKRIRLEDAWAWTEAQNPSLHAAVADRLSTDGLLDQAGARPNPELDLTVEDTRADRRVTTLVVGFPIELGGKREARIQAAAADRDFAEQTLSNARVELRASVVNAFFSVAIAQERLKAADAMRDVAQRGLDAADKQVTAGKVPPLERSRAQVAVANARIAQREAQLALRESRAGLAALWGDAQPGFEGVDASLDVLPAPAELDALRQAQIDSPRLAAGRLDIERSRAALAVARSKRYGDVRLNLGMARENEPGRNIAQVGVSFPLPLNDTNQGNIRAAAMQVERAEAAYRDLVLRSQVELGQAAAALELALESAREYEISVFPAADFATDATRKAFAAGKVGFTEVLDAQRTLFQARTEHLDVLARVYQRAAEVDRLSGRLR